MTPLRASRRFAPQGFSAIELTVVVAIIGIVMAIAIPAFNTMILNAKIKGVAESIQAGLRQARSEAIKRNAPMRFQLVTVLGQQARPIVTIGHGGGSAERRLRLLVRHLQEQQIR